MSESRSNQNIASLYCQSRKATTLYDKEIKLFWRYDGKTWRTLDMDDMADDLAIFCEKAAQSNRFTMATYRDIVEQCRRFTKQVPKLNDIYLSFNDTLLDPTDFSLHDHSPDKVATVHVDHDFATLPIVQTPLFDKYLKDSCNDPETGKEIEGMRDQLQELAGYILTPEITTKCFFLYGDGGTGKSVFLEILRRLISEERCLAMGLKEMTTKDFNLSALVGKRANIKDEEQTKASDLSFLKTIVAGEPITTRRLYGSNFTFRPRIKMYFGSNKFPRFGEFDNSIRRRFLIVPFLNIVPKEKKILHLDDKIIKAGELPGIVHWAIEGLKRLSANNFDFTETDKSQEAMKEFQDACSSVLEYLNANWEYRKFAKVTAKDLYQQYFEWCRDNRREAVSSNRFGREAQVVVGLSKNIRMGDNIVRGYEIVKKNRLDGLFPESPKNDF